MYGKLKMTVNQQKSFHNPTQSNLVFLSDKIYIYEIKKENMVFENNIEITLKIIVFLQETRELLLKLLAVSIY